MMRVLFWSMKRCYQCKHNERTSFQLKFLGFKVDCKNQSWHFTMIVTEICFFRVNFSLGACQCHGLGYYHHEALGLPYGSDGKESAYNVRSLGSIPGLGIFPWSRAWQPTPIFFPGEYSWTEEPGGLHSMALQESDMTEQLSIAEPSTAWSVTQNITHTKTTTFKEELSGGHIENNMNSVASPIFPKKDAGWIELLHLTATFAVWSPG